MHMLCSGVRLRATRVRVVPFRMLGVSVGDAHSQSHARDSTALGRAFTKGAAHGQ